MERFVVCSILAAFVLVVVHLFMRVWNIEEDAKRMKGLVVRQLQQKIRADTAVPPSPAPPPRERRSNASPAPSVDAPPFDARAEVDCPEGVCILAPEPRVVRGPSASSAEDSLVIEEIDPIGTRFGWSDGSLDDAATEAETTEAPNTTENGVPSPPMRSPESRLPPPDERPLAAYLEPYPERSSEAELDAPIDETARADCDPDVAFVTPGEREREGSITLTFEDPAPFEASASKEKEKSAREERPRRKKRDSVR